MVEKVGMGDPFGPGSCPSDRTPFGVSPLRASIPIATAERLARRMGAEFVPREIDDA